MPDLMTRLDELTQRVTNRLLWALPGDTIQVPTDVPVVSFTFDDVPDTALTAGADILERYEARGTFYIAGGLVGTVEPERRLIDAQGCWALAERGHEVACHTYAHPNIRHLTPRALAEDLDRNARFLADAIPGFAPANFAFPYNAGSFAARPELARRFRTSRGGGEGINRGPTDRTFLKGVAIQQPDESALALTAMIDDLVKNPGWLVFYTHDVADRPTPYGTTPKVFETLVAHARSCGCALLTIDQALDRTDPQRPRL
jgi:peptidoglycan/xylan/chitin deacetylase (PgdA/CDA1 family)